MTPEEIRALAERIAHLLDEQGWVPAPVRPEPPSGPHPGHLPAWAGSAQDLSDVAPGKRGSNPSARLRPAYDALVTAARGAAAGHTPSPTTGNAGQAAGRTVPVAVSNRHVHLSLTDVEQLFGAGHQLQTARKIAQPGQFAAEEQVTVVGPKGSIEAVRVVGPARGATQVELALSDCRVLGIPPVIVGSGNLGQAAPVTLKGPAGTVELDRGAIVPARHLHMSEADARRFRLSDGDRVEMAVGAGDRSGVLRGVLVRAGPTHATELHLDVDEAHAFNIQSDSTAVLLGRTNDSKPAPASRRLITERDVARLAEAGQTLSDASPFILTPSARDRARALGIWRDR